MDFSQFDFFDHNNNWWRRLKWLLNEVEAIDIAHYIELLYLRHCAVLSGCTDSKEALDHYSKSTGEMIDSLGDILFPWNDKKHRHSANIEELRKQLIEQCGDPDDPAVAARIQRALQKSREHELKHFAPMKPLRTKKRTPDNKKDK